MAGWKILPKEQAPEPSGWKILPKSPTPTPIEGGLSMADAATTPQPAPVEDRESGLSLSNLVTGQQPKPDLATRLAFSTPVQAVGNIPLAAAQLALSGPDEIMGIPTSGLDIIKPGARAQLREWLQEKINKRRAIYKSLPENQNVLADVNEAIIGGVAGARFLPPSVTTNMSGSMALRGAAGAMAEPVTGEADDVATGKLVQGAAGALGGAAMKGVAKGLGKAAKIFTKGEDFSPESVLKRFKEKVGGKSSDVLQEDLKAQYGAARAEASEAFRSLRDDAGDAVVDVPSYTSKLDALIQRESTSRAGADETVLKALNGLKKAVANPKADKSFGGTMDVGSRLNEIYGDAVSGQTPNRRLAGTVTELKKALQEDLDAAGNRFGDRYKEAKRLWQEKVVPWEDPGQGGRLIQNFIKSPTPDMAMDALLKAKSEDKLGIFVSKLSRDKGIPALQAGLVENVYRQSLDDGGRVIPTKFLGAMKARQDAYGLAFEGEAKWRMDGLTQLMRDSRFTAKLMTGEWLRNVPGGRVLPGSAFPTPDGGATLQKFFTTPGISKFLVQAQAAKPGSEQMGRIINQIAARVSGTNAQQSETMQTVLDNQEPTE